METLWNYIVQTLKDAWVNVILQQDYLTWVAKWLIKYLIFSNSLWIFVGLIMMITAIMTYIGWLKEVKNTNLWRDDMWWRICIILVCGMIWPILFGFGLDGLMKVLLVPDIAILKYIS
jgi:hypothetical protein